jgi:hypothetical protein
MAKPASGLPGIIVRSELGLTPTRELRNSK